MKRALDIALAGIGLVVALPVLAVIAASIKLGSTGPVFFRQTRVGRIGHEFQIHKFRTMRVGEPGPAVTIGQDPRVTRVGRFLRRTKLDELPQLLDVLQGAMSLVGPRPEVPEYVALWPPDVREVVLSVRPGITDPAALEFRDESLILAEQADPERYYREVLMPQKLELYSDYIARATAGRDLLVIAQTVRALIRDRRPPEQQDASARAVIFGVALYVAITFLLYRFYLSRIWYYEGLTWRAPTWWSILIALAVIGVCAWFMPRFFRRISDVCLWLVFTVAVIPSILVAEWSQRLSPGDAALLAIAVGGGLMLMRLLTWSGPVGLFPPMRTGRWFWILGWVFSGVLYVWLLKIVDVKFAYLSFGDVYAVRAQFKEGFTQSDVLPYLFPFTYAVFNPLVIGVGWVRRAPLMVLAGVAAQTFVYVATGHKFALLAIPFVVLLSVMTAPGRVWPVWRLPVMWAVLMTLGRIMDGLTGNLMWSAVLTIRFLLIPGVLTSGYVDFFQSHQYTMFTDVLPFVQDGYKDPFVLVGESLFGTEGTNANVNFFGDGYMNLGYAGMLIEAVVAAILLRLADESCMRISLSAACAIFALPTISLTNGSAFTAIFTYGFAFAIVVGWWCPLRDTRQVGSGSDPARVRT